MKELYLIFIKNLIISENSKTKFIIPNPQSNIWIFKKKFNIFLTSYKGKTIFI